MCAIVDQYVCTTDIFVVQAFVYPLSVSVLGVPVTYIWTCCNFHVFYESYTRCMSPICYMSTSALCLECSVICDRNR